MRYDYVYLSGCCNSHSYLHILYSSYVFHLTCYLMLLCQLYLIQVHNVVFLISYFTSEHLLFFYFIHEINVLVHLNLRESMNFSLIGQWEAGTVSAQDHHQLLVCLEVSRLHDLEKNKTTENGNVLLSSAVTSFRYSPCLDPILLS